MKSIICFFGMLFLVASCTNASSSWFNDHSRSRLSDSSSTGLELIRTHPAPDSIDIPTDTGILIQYNQALGANDVSSDNFHILGVKSEIIHDNDAIVLIPLSPLKENTKYTVIAKRLNRSPTKSNNTPVKWSFYTGATASTPPPQGLPTVPGKKILLRFPYVQSYSPNEVRIMWTTRHSGQGRLSYRLKPGVKWLSAKTKETLYRKNNTGLSYNYFQYEAVLKGLESDTAYEYRVMHSNTRIANSIHFKTLPAADAKHTRFIAFGDSGTKYSQPRAVRDRIINRKKNGGYSHPHDFIVGLGDIAYFTGSYLDFEKRFFDQLSARGDQGNGKRSMLATRPFVPVLGNHEYADNDSGTPSAFLSNFSSPAPDNILTRDRERYFSFDSGLAHFIVLDSMKFLNDNSPGIKEMIDWLDNDLSSTKKTWKIIFLHHAIFSNGPHGTYGDMPLNKRMRQKLSPLLQKHNVQLVLNGHDHLYQRSIPLKVSRNGLIIRNKDCSIQTDRKGIVYVVVGIGGNDLHARELDPVSCKTNKYKNIIAEYGDGYDFVATRNGKPVIYDQKEMLLNDSIPGWGFLHISISGPLLTGVAYNIDGKVLDRFSIVSPLP